MSRTTCLIVLTLLFGTNQAQATTLTFPLSVEFSGSVAPAGSTPWLTATFDDGDSAGSVTLSLETTNITAVEYVSQWLFNLDPVLDPTQLSFLQQSKVGTFKDPKINTEVDAFMVDGDGLADIQFKFFNGNSQRFGAGESVVYNITGIASLTANSFNFNSAPVGGQGIFPTAAHVQGIGINEDSGWITIPEPNAIFIAAFGLLGLFSYAWLKRSAA